MNHLKSAIAGIGCAAMAVFLAAGSSHAEPPARTVPHTLATHPGNIFTAGEEVKIALGVEAKSWTLKNYDGKKVASGDARDGIVSLGVLPVGYYELSNDGETAGARPISLGVVEPLHAAIPLDSPVGLDVALSWCFAPSNWPKAISLCQLAGINWVRDRVFWAEMEPQRGVYSTTNRNDASVQLQTDAGLRVLDVNHASPDWANPTGKRIPLDLRDAFNGYRELARRWRGKIAAFEPWNEADIIEFGGHTGDEMASMQKASYFGLKAGNPELIICENVFAIHRQTTLRNFNENKAWPYFDTFNLHNYDPLVVYPKTFADYREVSAGRPLWETECSWTVEWSGDEQLKEPDQENTRLQSERLVKTYAQSIHEGVQAVFFFMLPHYTERKTQYGLLHPDLSPRPGYLSLAAVGRFLAGAKPLGRVDDRGRTFNGYLFDAKPDGKEADVMVVWSDGANDLKLPKPPLARYDHLGRSLPVSDETLPLTRAPQFVILPHNSRPPLIARPADHAVLAGKPCPVVFQALIPEATIDLKRSGYKLSGSINSISIYAYNFGDAKATGNLELALPEKFKADVPKQFSIAPGERKEIVLHLTTPASWEMAARVALKGEFGKLGNQTLAMRFFAPTKTE